MANQVKTVFSVDTRAAIGAIDAYERRLRLVTELESKIGTKAGGTSRGSSASSGADREMKAAMADIAKMQRERERMEREVTRSVEREARLQSQARVREAKRSANEMIAELRRIEKERDHKQAVAGVPMPGMLSGLGGWIAGAVSTAAIISAVKTTTAVVKESEAANRALAASAFEAGKSYTALAESSKAFGQAALISESAAARSTAQLQRLLTLAGSPDQLERYQKGFLDLAAARGVAFDELDTLFQGIIAGTDDALNRFGKQDPSKLAEQYARSIGKTVEQLTEQEKILSRLKAFDKDFGLFNGANEDRVKSFGGAVDRLNKSLDDVIANFGRWASQSRVTRDNLQFLNDLTGSASVPTEGKLNDMFKAGMTDQQILQAMGRGRVTRYDRVLSAATYAIGTSALPALLGMKPQSPEEIRRQEDSTVSAQIAASRRAFERGAEGAQTQATSASDRLKSQFEEADKKVKEMQASLQSVRQTIMGILAERNPFVAIFENAYQSLQKVRELTRGFGADLQNLAVATVQRQALQQYQNAIVSSQLQSYNLSSAASDFRSGINLEALTPQQQARRQLNQLRGQLTSIGAYQSAPTMQVLGPDATRKELAKARADYEAAMARYQAAQPARDRQIIELTQGMNPARLDSATRDIAAGAREREARRIADQDREARNLFKSLSGIINQDGIKVVLGSGEQVVRIVNEAPGNATVTRPTSSSVGNRYGRN